MLLSIKPWPLPHCCAVHPRQAFWPATGPLPLPASEPSADLEPLNGKHRKSDYRKEPCRNDTTGSYRAPFSQEAQIAHIVGRLWTLTVSVSWEMTISSLNFSLRN